ncbi:vWA domain-containing protein [Flavobacterium sp. AJR]|uniref:vWA domain-containing protein n=1 Tax=Flavobacterium sp. AJR TaxID=1979369 RepID=UPI000A3D6ABA|nr:vWA domain-containing protein [Flavobacterium sp. AJR]OUL63703.1 hypothetical protein B8T70_03685 [Flavobacterium sp. AJR]
MSPIILQDSQSSGCETYIAIVVDESGSISETEAVQIRSGLTSFIESQTESNKLTLSLIGMSHSDHDLRQDHIIQKRVSDNKQNFLNWIKTFRSRNINIQSDYWASGLEVVNKLTVTPDIIIMVTDGLQVTNPSVLQNFYQTLNQKSHVFVYGVKDNSYGVDPDRFVNLYSALESNLKRVPVLKTAQNSILITDYIELNDFTELNDQLTTLTSALASANVGCLANVDIIENKLVYPALAVGKSIINKEVGSLIFKNKSRIDLTLTAGTKIHNPETSVGGFGFIIKNTTVISAQSSAEVTILINGTPTQAGNFLELITIENINNSNQFKINFNVEKELSYCETYVAIVVDESGSISETEAVQIRSGLTSFIESQTESSKLTLSLIGMSNSDNDLRQDHIIQKRVSSNKQDFLDWIDTFGSRTINAQSDYWASGLQAVNKLTVTPDIIIVVTDGMQVNNTNILKDLYSTLNKKSHVFVYGVTGNDAETTIQTELVKPLSFYLGKSPVLKIGTVSMLDSDYIRYPDFANLNFELNKLSTDLAINEIGCMAKVTIIENKLVYPALSKGIIIHKQAGSLVLKNESRNDLKLTAGTKIHNSTTLNGLVFTLKSTINIPAYSQQEVAVLIDGKPLLSGDFTELIALEKVNNPNKFSINFNVIKRPTVDITEKTLLQSSSFYLSAAGSRGNDSTKGVHLRWLLAGELGEKHLPKGDSFTGTEFNFTKKDDFVKVYRSPYTKISTTLDLNTPPQLVDSKNAFWVYKMNGGKRIFHVYFRDAKKYASISINPLTNPSGFIQAYGNKLIEIQNQTELFFAAELNFNSINNSSILRLETLSEVRNAELVEKKVTVRKTYTSSQLDTVRVQAENGRSIRFKANNCSLNKINFEFYSDFILHANESESWDVKGKYALSLDEAKVFEQLEPQLNSVHGKWLKYNNGEYVNIVNYKDKWNRTTDADDRNISEVVENYIKLSNNKLLDNPTATETVSLGASLDGEDADNTTTISNLDLLNIAANDYHIARMLGLGYLDTEETVLSGDYIYLAEYTTLGDLKDGLGARKVQHISMSVPTSINDERLPLPIQLNKIVPGLNVGEDGNESTKITDKDGYSFDGKKRYASLFMEDVMDYDTDELFFNSSIEYDGSTFSFPIYAGVDYKVNQELNWRKPELAHDSEYSNVYKDLKIAHYEPTPIIIPESKKSFLNVRQGETGLHIYQGYGINIFSRATSGKQVSITSDIKPTNTLMAPSSINALLITEENPLMFTTQNEQNRLEKITSDDDTFIRVLFDYYSIHELVNYSIPKEMNPKVAEEDPEAIYPDNEELFADSFDIFYRNSLPLGEIAKIVSVENNQDDSILSTVTIKGHTILSTGEKIVLGITKTNKDRFIGGILTIGNQNFVVNKVEIIDSIDPKKPNDFSVTVEVMNKEVASSIFSEGNATIDSEQIQPIIIPENKLCTLVENMLTPTNWHKLGPIDFKVQYPTNLKKVNRETIYSKDPDGNKNYQVEKTRGIWESAFIERVTEVAYENDANGNQIPLEDEKHLGLYKITFPGFKLEQHPQYKGQNIENSVEWFNGIIRLFTEHSIEKGGTTPVKPRKEFKVFRTDNIGGTDDLVLYINDSDFKLVDDGSFTMDPTYDEIRVGHQKVNYYPSYKTYLFANPAYDLTKENIYPEKGENTRYSIFGIRSHSDKLDYDSKISTPSPMYAVTVEKPIKPEEVKGSLYATRPDFFKRSTYTFTTKYSTKDGHKPHGILHYRANDEALLSVLYERKTINTIREKLKELGGNNEKFFANRWENFLDFGSLLNLNKQLNPGDLLEPGQVPVPAPVRKLIEYNEYPQEEDALLKFRFPLPDNEELIKSINDFIDWHNKTQKKSVKKITKLTALNQILISKEDGIKDHLLAIHFIEQAVHTAFVPLTEVPIIYDAINAHESYVPIAKKQTIKDKNGNILKPTDSDFDIAPMMKMINVADNITQFTDFTLDGTSQNIYFYGVREMDIKMNFSEFGPFLGPVKLVASNPPQTPEIKRIMPVLANPVLGIQPAIQIELNPYQPEHKIRKINIYRADSLLNAQSTRTMTLVKEIIIDEETLSDDFDNIWTVYDDFEDLENIPFGEGLFYRVTVSREIEYADPSSTEQNTIIHIDYAPSQPSKITATVIADNVSPESPVLKASGIPIGANKSVLKPVIFNWEKTVHNGKYHLYKMNNQGNWDEIHVATSNKNEIIIPLEEIKGYSDELIIKTQNDERIYHHFKLISENSSGMFSYEENILTL